MTTYHRSLTNCSAIPGRRICVICRLFRFYVGSNGYIFRVTFSQKYYEMVVSAMAMTSPHDNHPIPPPSCSKRLSPSKLCLRNAQQRL